MTTDAFEKSIRHQPFQPYTLKTAAGDSYRVSHPEQLWWPNRARTVMVATGKSFVILDLITITSIEHPTMVEGLT